MDTYLKSMTHCDEIMLNKYVNTRILFIIYLTVNACISRLSVCFGPILFANQKLPFDVWYPVSMESKTIIILLYIAQAIFVTYCTVCTIFDFISTTLLWILAARFELLQNDFEFLSSEKELKFSIRKHQQLIR